MAKEQTPKTSSNVFNNLPALKPGQIISLEEQRARLEQNRQSEIELMKSLEDTEGVNQVRDKKLEIDGNGSWSVPPPERSDENYWTNFLADYRRGSVGFPGSSKYWVKAQLQMVEEDIQKLEFSHGQAELAQSLPRDFGESGIALGLVQQEIACINRMKEETPNGNIPLELEKSLERRETVLQINLVLNEQLDFAESMIMQLNERKLKLEVELRKCAIEARIEIISGQLENIQTELALFQEENRRLLRNRKLNEQLFSAHNAITEASPEDARAKRAVYTSLSQCLKKKIALEKQQKIIVSEKCRPEEVSSCLSHLMQAEFRVSDDQLVGFKDVEAANFSEQSALGLTKTVQQSLYGIHKLLAVGFNPQPGSYPQIDSDSSGYRVILARDANKITATLYTDILLSEAGHTRSLRSRFEIDIKDLTNEKGNARVAPVKLVETCVVAPDLKTVLELWEKIDLKNKAACFEFARTVLKPYIVKQTQLSEDFSVLKEIASKQSILLDKAKSENLSRANIELLKKVFALKKMCEDSEIDDFRMLTNSAGLSVFSAACLRMGGRSDAMAALLEEVINAPRSSLLSLDEIQAATKKMDAHALVGFEDVTLIPFVTNLEDVLTKMNLKVKERNVVNFCLREDFIKNSMNVKERTMEELIKKAVLAKRDENYLELTRLTHLRDELIAKQEKLTLQIAAMPSLLRRLSVSFPFLAKIFPFAKVRLDLQDTQSKLATVKLKFKNQNLLQEELNRINSKCNPGAINTNGDENKQAVELLSVPVTAFRSSSLTQAEQKQQKVMLPSLQTAREDSLKPTSAEGNNEWEDGEWEEIDLGEPVQQPPAQKKKSRSAADEILDSISEAVSDVVAELQKKIGGEKIPASDRTNLGHTSESTKPKEDNKKTGGFFSKVAFFSPSKEASKQEPLFGIPKVNARLG